MLAAGASGWAQSSRWLQREDPLWSEFVPRLRYLKMDVEAERSTYASKLAGGAGFDSQRLQLTPGLGIGWNNYLYHPSLFTFSILAEPGYTLEQVTGSGYNYNRDAILVNGLFKGILLQEKPYATTVSYSRSHDDFHYDFFNSTTADSQGWGVVTGYREGPVPVLLTFDQSSTDTLDASRETLQDSISLKLHARNERTKQSVTDLNYQFSDQAYDSRYKLASFSTESSYHNVSITDMEHFGRGSLSSMLRYNNVSTTQGASLSDLNASFGYNLSHTPHLQSYYNYSFSDFVADDADSIHNSFAVGITHQLYESLASDINVHGSTFNSTFNDSTFDSVSFGVGNSEDYTKRLGDWGRLTIGNTVGYDVTDQQVAGGTVFIPDENYKVPAIGPMIIRLLSPRATSITSVKKNNLELDPSEYAVIKSSDPWQIQFFSGGPNNIQHGDTVSVSYTVQPNPSGNYSVLNDNCYIRLSFWQDRAEIYARYSLTANEASTSDFLLQDIQLFEVGGRCDWRGFRAAASYTDQQSTLYDYQSLTFSEGYSTPISSHSSAGIELSQQWNVYPPGSGTSTNSTQTATAYNLMAHFDWSPVTSLRWHVEAGYEQESGIGYGQDLFAARTSLDWQVGKLEFRLGYQHDNREYITETRTRDFVFLRMRRNF
ncbi:MAG: hypothetical protein EPO07_02695 [Verrucomicrobia bacterium]|nr:MAG: hypothetical protein EPO07_02695 [Verrucomicrobiota bacterium]